MMLVSLLLCAVSASALLIPVLLIADRARIRDIRRTFLYYLTTLYFCIVYKLVGPLDITYFRWDPEISWIPLIGIVDDLRSSLLNVLLFIPLGAILPILWKKYRSLKRSVMVGLGLSFLIELSQLFTYRATDINDLITNTVGTVIGYSIVRPFFGKLPAYMNGERDHLPLLLCISTAVMFFAEPFIFQFLYRLF